MDWREIVEKLYPEREFLLRSQGRVRYLRLTRRLQIAASAVAFVLFSWLASATLTAWLQRDVIDFKEAKIDRQQLAYERLIREVSDYQEEVATVTGQIRANQLKLLEQMSDRDNAPDDGAPGTVDAPSATPGGGAEQDLESEVAHLDTQLAAINQMSRLMSANLEEMSERLQQAMSERDQVASARKELWARLQDAQAALATQEQESERLRERLRNTTLDLAAVTEERARIADEREQFRGRVGDLETQLTEMSGRQTSFLSRLASKTADRIREAEDVLRMTGVDLDKLMTEAGVPQLGQGGPLVAAVPAGAEASLELTAAGLAFQVERWDSLRDVLYAVPLSAPVDNYYISSGYGRRIDPFTKRPAMHNGLDMASRRGSSIYAAAPGVVTFAGARSNYGRMIEIDHGFGIRTRYGHLRRVLVKRGTEVHYRQKIGLMGNTGRSTGPHLHYEIWANGKPHDPIKFLQAGRYVYKPAPTIEEMLGFQLPKPKPVRSAGRVD